MAWPLSGIQSETRGLAIGSHVKSLALRGKLYHAVQKYEKESQEKKK